MNQNQNTGFSYDSNGNIVFIPVVPGTAVRSFWYDAENRQEAVSITGVTPASASYVYDGLGQRVMKFVCAGTGPCTSTTSGAAQTTYVYDAFGNLAAEYGSAEPSPCGTNTPCYVSVDQLGSTRMLMDSTGTVQKRYDYEPFGAEITTGYGGRTGVPGMGYDPSSLDDFGPKFTGQSRDPETVMDWFNVRHTSPAQGRFQSVDPGNAGADPSDPQTWNMYSYVANNPLSYTDPSGMDAEGGCGICDVLALIGIGIADAFGLGSHHTPSLADFPFPNQFPSAGPSGGPLGPGSGDPWNEQSPIGGSGSPVGTGGLFGSGNTSPFVFGFADQAPDISWADLPGQWYAGFVDLFLNNKPSGGVRMAGAVTADLTGGWLLGKGISTVAAMPKMTVGVTKGDLWSSPVHVLFRPGQYWMHANGPSLGRMIITTRNAEGIAKNAFQFRVPILNPGAVEATEGTKAASCVTGFFYAFFKGWGC